MATNIQILTAVETLFSSSDWTDNNIKTYPTNYQGKIDSNEWVRLNVFPFSSNVSYNDINKSGQIVCNIFVPSGQGMKRAYEIADILSNILERKTISGYLQTTNSFITNIGVDIKNAGLYSVDFTVDFKTIN
jgi:hypothetical protein